jgi:hypothetical protein
VVNRYLRLLKSVWLARGRRLLLFWFQFGENYIQRLFGACAIRELKFA